MPEKAKSDPRPIRGAALRLAVLCMAFYAVTYLCRKSFDSNINEIKSAFSQGDSAVGLISTCFFVAYAVGQVIHGFLCRLYAPRPVLFGMGLVVAALNLSMGLIPVEMFSLLKFIWMANGFACASFWSLLIMTLNRCIAKEHRSVVMFVTCFPVAVGSFFSYAISALFSFFGKFRTSFLVTASIMTAAAVYWFLRSPRLMDACLAEKKERDGEDLPDLPKEATAEKKKVPRGFSLLFGTLAFFAVVNNFIRDGLNTWTPTFLTETYGMENWIAVMLSVTIPTVALFAGILSVSFYRKQKDLRLLCGIFFGVSALVLTVMLGAFPFGSWLVTLICLVLSSLLMASVNNILTSLFPLNVGEGINAGTVAGVIDGFCYLGSALSAYGIGKIAEETGDFFAAFRIMILCSVFCMAAALFFTFKAKGKNKGTSIYSA